MSLERHSGQTLVERTYGAIRQRITEGVYLPNQRLTEAELVQSLGVSRMSVRAALQRLHQEGLITLEPYRGAKVVSISLEEAMEVMELRQGLEGWAASLAAVRITEQELAGLDAVLAEMRQVVREGRLLDHADLNAVLHQSILEAARNSRLKQAIDLVKFPIVTYQFRTIFLAGRAQQSLQEHAEIVEALRSRSANRAEVAMRSHIAVIRELMTDRKMAAYAGSYGGTQPGIQVESSR